MFSKLPLYDCQPTAKSFTETLTDQNDRKQEFGKTATSAPKVTEAPKESPVTNMKRAAKTGKSSAEEPKPTNLVSAPKPNQSLMEQISDLLENLQIYACVVLTRRLLASVPASLLGRLGLTLS